MNKYNVQYGLHMNISHTELCDFLLNGSHWHETHSGRNCSQEPVEHFLWLPLDIKKTSIFHGTRKIFYSARSHSCRRHILSLKQFKGVEISELGTA